MLPAAFPNLLVNGASGIAVGMATNMATHNLGEVVAAAQYLMSNPDASLMDLMRFVPGPDWPTGGIIVGRDGIKEAYEHGRGAVITRSATHIENVTARKKAIVVTELPFMVGPERVLERISEGVKNRKLEGISGAIDLTDRHNGTRLVIEIKTGFDPEAVLAQLFRHTPLQESFTINNVALVNGRPHTMGLKELLNVWIDHRRLVVKRRSEYRKRKALERLHLVEGLLLALIDIDEVIQVIRSSDDADAAKTRLMAVFDLDDIQAQYILDLRLRRLTRISRIELETEQDELHKRIEELNIILSSKVELDKVVTDEMSVAAQTWGNPRRTVLLDADPSGSLSPVAITDESGAASQSASAFAAARSVSSLSSHTGSARAATANSAADKSAGLRIEDKPCTVMLSAAGLIARSSANALDGWRSRSASDGRTENDQIVSIFSTTTQSNYALVTSAGRYVLAHVSDLPALPATAALSVSGGVRADELLGMTQSTEHTEHEHVVAAVVAENTIPLAIGTRNGIIKRWNGEAPSTMDSWNVIDLKSDDQVVFAAPADDDAMIVFISSDSSLLAFHAKDVRPQGRNAAGMAGIRLSEGQHVCAFNAIAAGQISWTYVENDDNGMTSQAGAVVFTVAGDSQALAGTENGCGKVTPLEMYPTKGRGSRGVRSQRFLKGQDTLILACIGTWPLRASSASGTPVDLPEVDMRRDASGQDLSAPIAYIA